MKRDRDSGGDARKRLVLSGLASLLIFLGIAALVAPPLLEALLPPAIATALIEHAWAILIAGFGLEGYQIYRHVASTLARARGAATPVAPTPAESAPQDPLAQRTPWTGASRGGANFRTRRLVACGSSRFEVRATTQMLLFCWAFIAIGLTLGAALAFVGRHDPLSPQVLAPVAFGLVFVAVGAVMLYFATRRGVFDRRTGWYWKGSSALRSPGDLRKLAQATELSNIHALQLIAERVRDQDSDYVSYELNLVLKDGRRLNVMDHGDQATVVADAETLARFLGAPVWKQPTNPPLVPPP